MTSPLTGGPHALLFVALFCLGCTSTPRKQEGQTLVTPYKSPERIRTALQSPPQQFQQGGELWETYIIADEQITVHYQFIRRQ